ncbi:hypothetical protein [Pantoea agglomerans]|uniref:hypothetical protein n=1 Tax=Enterobacter agglomerans TaxID=549 RepID=UPI0032098519
MDAKDFIELVIKHGWPVVIALAAYRIVNLVFDWISQTEPVGLLKVLFNRRRQHLEKMLSLPYLSRKTRNLAQSELNQMARKKLTGFSDPRIQEQLTEICSRFSLPPRYFTRWRALVVNMSVWYLPWLFLTSPMAPPPTREMEAYIDSFNAFREGE